MTILLLIGLLQAPDDLRAFLASLEKIKGATPAQLIEKIDAWSSGKPEEVLARIAWNRTLLESTIKIDGLFVEGLNKRLGQKVTLGRSTGTLKEVKPDRVVLAVSGGTIELEFTQIAYEVRLEDIKKQGLLPDKSAAEAIFRFAAGKSATSMAAALGLAAGEDRDKAFAAIAGWALQETDAALAAGPLLKAAENFAATWGKQPEVIAAGGGAVRKFIDATLAPKLVDEADAILEKDRPGARKLLDLAASLCKAQEIADKVSERRWSVLDKGEWMALSLESISIDGGEVKGKAIFYEDTEKEEKGRVTGLRVSSLGISWDEISGVRAKVKPGKGELFDMRLSFNKRKIIHSMVVQPKEGFGYRVTFEAGKDSKVGAGSTRKVPKKTDYDFQATWEGKKWKYSISGTDIDTFDIADTPDELMFIASDGTAELLGLQIRKK